MSGEPGTTGRQVVGFSGRRHSVPGDVWDARAGIAGKPRLSCATTNEIGLVQQVATSLAQSNTTLTRGRCWSELLAQDRRRVKSRASAGASGRIYLLSSSTINFQLRSRKNLI